MRVYECATYVVHAGNNVHVGYVGHSVHLQLICYNNFKDVCLLYLWYFTVDRGSVNKLFLVVSDYLMSLRVIPPWPGGGGVTTFIAWKGDMFSHTAFEPD